MDEIESKLREVSVARDVYLEKSLKANKLLEEKKRLEAQVAALDAAITYVEEEESTYYFNFRSKLVELREAIDALQNGEDHA